MVWVKCTTPAECKPIRIAESSVMDGCKDHYISNVKFWFFYKWFLRKRSLCRTEYLEGTAVARVWFRVLGEYCRRLEVVMSD
jgi:hypothetical protein